MEQINYILDSLSEADLQKKLLIILSSLILILAITLIVSLFSYEQDVEDTVKDFIMASESLNISKLLNITTGVIHENLSKQNEIVYQIKQQTHYKGKLTSYNIDFLEKKENSTTVEVITEIRETMKLKPSRTYQHIFMLDLIKIRNEWKIANLKVIRTLTTG